MAHFLEYRSCNDDYVPFRVTRSTCEQNTLEQNTLEQNTNIHFKENEQKIPWLNFEEDTRLAAIDARLEHICYVEEARINNDKTLIEQQLIENNKEIIEEYTIINKISVDEAIEYLKSCHYCGNTDIPFGDEYCNERCQDYAIEFCYPCFRAADCKVCDNYWRHSTYIYRNGYIYPDDDGYEEYSFSDRHNYELDEEEEQELEQELEDDIDDDDIDCHPTMEEYYNSINNNDEEEEPTYTSTSLCRACKEYVYKNPNSNYCEPCINYHGKSETGTIVYYNPDE